MINKLSIGVLGLLAFGSWIGYSELEGNGYFLLSAIFFGVLFLGGIYTMWKDK